MCKNSRELVEHLLPHYTVTSYLVVCVHFLGSFMAYAEDSGSESSDANLLEMEISLSQKL